MMFCVRSVFLVLFAVILVTSYDGKAELNGADDYELIHDGHRTSWVLKNERRRLLGSSDRNQVELYVMSNAALTKRFTDKYGSSRAFNEIKAFVLDIVNGASKIYEKKNWGPAGRVSLHLVELEVVTSYTGSYSSLYPNFPYTNQKLQGRYNCRDPLGYKAYADGGCMITGNADGNNRDKAMLWKFKNWIASYKANSGYDDHLLLVGNAMAGIKGVAFRSGICKRGWNIAVVGAGHAKLIADIKTTAHEIGHNFGMQHVSTRSGSVMGGWTSWDGEPSFGSEAYTYLNGRFKEANKLSCLRNGLRGFRQGRSSGRLESSTGDEGLACLDHNTYGSALTVSGSLWNDTKTFTLKGDECMHNKVIFHHVLSEVSGATYRLYYDEYEETVTSMNDSSYDAEEVVGRWVISLNGFESAQCGEEDLLDCVRGKWQIYEGDEEEVAIVVDETLFVSQSTAKEANGYEESITKSALFWIVIALVIAVIAVIVFVVMRRQRKGKAMFTIDEESEEEEVEVHLDGVDVEQTNLTKTTA